MVKLIQMNSEGQIVKKWWTWWLQRNISDEFGGVLKLVFSYKYSKYEIDKNIPSPVLVIEGLQLSEYGAKTYSERSV